MQTSVQKWGNSLGLRIPSVYAKELHLLDGSFQARQLINIFILFAVKKIDPDWSIYYYHCLLLLMSSMFPSQFIFPFKLRISYIFFLSIRLFKAKSTSAFFVLIPVIAIPFSTSLSSKTILVLISVNNLPVYIIFI